MLLIASDFLVFYMKGMRSREYVTYNSALTIFIKNDPRVAVMPT